MDDSFALTDPTSAQLFMKSMPVQSRGKGESLFRRGLVQTIKVKDPATSYSAEVMDGRLLNVDLFFDAEDGWDAECSCHRPLYCEHIYAGMSALLAEHRTALVRNLSSSLPRAAAAMAASRPRQEEKPGNELLRRVTESLGRRLDATETKYVKNIQKIYARCSQTRRITVWDFLEMGIRLQGYGWEDLKIWPSFPATEHEFWLYVAQAASERGIEIHEFMRGATDLGPLRKRIDTWRRTQEIEDWKNKLSNIELPPAHLKSQAHIETDLRLVIGDELRLQCKKAGEEEFEYLKQSHFRQFSDNYDFGRIQLTGEAELLWQFFSLLFQEGITRLRFDFLDATTLRRLGRLFRTRQLDSRIVNSMGKPLERIAEPLRWELTAAMDRSDDYRLRLVQASGEPAPQWRVILSGEPTLYVTENAVFTGPLPHEHVVDPGEENKIPAVALECPAGVQFLQAAGVPLPPRIQNKLQLLQYDIAISCKLQRFQSDNNAEECIVTLQAEAPDGRQQTWTGYAWTESHRATERTGRSGSDTIKVYERSKLDRASAVLEPLGLRASTYGHGLSVKVTKKFPELFTTWLKSVPADMILHLEGDLASLATPDVAGRVKLDATEIGIDWFDLSVVLDVSDTTLTREEIKLLLNAKGNYVRLAGKGWRRLKYDISEEQDERLARLGLSPRELSAEPQRLHALQLADDAAKKLLPEEQVERIQRRASEIKTRVSPDIPQGVTAQLRPYQLHGYHFLAYLASNRFGGILADDMGLGKTLQTLAWLLWLRESNKGVTPASIVSANGGDALAAGKDESSVSPGLANEQSLQPEHLLPSLVVCPKSVMDNWRSEATRFTPGLRVRIWPSSQIYQLCDELGSADLHVVNYNQLRLLGEHLKKVHWLALILDEGQYIKNPGSQTAQVARGLRAEHRLVLSGTPIENRLLDLWSLMAFAMPGVLGNRAQFARLHDAKGDPFARRRLAARVRPFVLRRTKGQVAKDLPDRIEEDLFCEIEGEQQTLYRAELKSAQQLLLGVKTQKELAKNQFNFLTSLLRLRQICCDPRLLKGDCPTPGAKTEALLDVVEPIMEEGQKVLVFSQFVEVLHLLRPMLAERNWPLFYLAGETENRGELVERFQSTEGPAIFLISLKAGGFGLNLTAASYVVLFDPWWNPAVENQAIDRTHRIGQSNKVIAYRLLIKNSIEEKIRALQRTKKALAEDVLGEEKFAQSLTLDDLHFLFAD